MFGCLAVAYTQTLSFVYFKGTLCHSLLLFHSPIEPCTSLPTRRQNNATTDSSLTRVPLSTSVQLCQQVGNLYIHLYWSFLLDLTLVAGSLMHLVNVHSE